jgi:pseudouridine synthase
VKQRLQKILAQAGYGSRRSAESLIADGRVRVNGAVSNVGMQADPDVDRVEVDGVAIASAIAHVYLALNKPAGYTTTVRDPHASKTVIELLPPSSAVNLAPVGRLDRDTEGLLIFTNDGELAHRLAHPRYRVAKEYYALVRATPGARALERLRRGVVIDDRKTAPADAAIATAPQGHAEPEGHTWLRVVIHEGRKRQVRRMCLAVGHPVRKLVRTRVGPVELGTLAPGRTRPLLEHELDALRKLLSL